MSAKPPPTDLPTQGFSSEQEFEVFLEEKHATSPGLYVKFAKKAAGVKSITPAEACDVGLCYGWIGGRAHGLDDDFWLCRYTPRRPKSLWSLQNVNSVARLMEQGRMRAAGLATVEEAKANGQWERAYAGPATIKVQDDLAAALSANPEASAFFETLNKMDRYSVLWRVQTASPTARAQRIEAIVQMLATGKVPGAEVKAAARTSMKTAAQERKRASGAAKRAVNSAKKAATQDKISKESRIKKPLMIKKEATEALKPGEVSLTQPRREGLRRRGE